MSCQKGFRDHNLTAVTLDLPLAFTGIQTKEIQQSRLQRNERPKHFSFSFYFRVSTIGLQMKTGRFSEMKRPHSLTSVSLFLTINQTPGSPNRFINIETGKCTAMQSGRSAWEQ